MTREIKLPEIASNIDHATVLALLVSVGDKVEKDQNIIEMESDKATFELPTNYAGTVKEIKVGEGDDVKVGQVVMILETEDEEPGEPQQEEQANDESQQKQQQAKEHTAEAEKEKPEKKEEDKKEESKPQQSEETTHQKPEAEKQDDPEQGQVKDKKQDKPDVEEQDNEEHKEVAASPSIRRLARELGVNIYRVEGTGPYERITSEDVKAYAKDMVKKSGGSAAEQEDYEMPDFSSFGQVERKPLDSIRQKIATAMSASWQNIPHVFHFDKADVTQLEAFRKKYSKHVESQGAKLTVTAILLKVLSKALEAFPKFNASLDMANAEIIYKKYYNIGVAVDTDRGLLVPVIRNVNNKSIVSLSKELGELAEKARNKKIMPDDMQGGNMAISNLGGIGGTNFTPIIYRPNVAILGVSRTTTEPVFIDGEFKPRMILPLSLSYDHRLIDGAEAARFLRWICEALENPFLMMFEGGEQ